MSHPSSQPVLDVAQLARGYPFAFACWCQYAQVDPLLEQLSPAEMTHYFAHQGYQLLYDFLTAHKLPISIERVDSASGGASTFTAHIQSQQPLQRFTNRPTQRAAEVAVLAYAFELLERKLYSQGEHSINHYTSWGFEQRPYQAERAERYLEVSVFQQQGPLFSLRFLLYLN